MFAEKNEEEVMDNDSMVFTEPSSSDRPLKGILSRLPLLAHLSKRLMGELIVYQ